MIIVCGGLKDLRQASK